MLTLNTADHTPIITALRSFHQTNNVNALPAGVTYDPTNKGLVIDYGIANSPKTGSVYMERGQYSITKCTNEKGALVPMDYTHSTEDIAKYQQYKEALGCTNLSAPDKIINKSAIINLLSECSRSNMVLKAFQKLMASYKAFSDDEWGGLKFAFNKYSDVCNFVHVGYKAGDPSWRPLDVNDYQNYINSPAYPNKGDIKYITAVSNLIQ